VGAAEVGRCPDADDNALEPTVKGQRFPTGQAYPPAHPGCRCLVVPTDRDPAPDPTEPPAERPHDRRPLGCAPMRVPTQERRSFRLRAWIIGFVAILIVLLLSLRGWPAFYTDSCGSTRSVKRHLAGAPAAKVCPRWCSPPCSSSSWR